jgi:uncharacterized integral membrane protein (TIGR00697 family)
MASLPYRYVSSALHERRERVFLIFVALFLGSMTMLNILGVSRFIDMSFEVFGLRIPFVLAIGVLPYPITFLCTDFISEFWGRRRANYVVLMGLLLNVWVFVFLWVGGLLPPLPELGADGLPDPAAYEYAFYRIRKFTLSAISASMIAYLAAQLCDVYLFHFWKRLTRGRHLWLRNNGSTIVSQFVDTVAVIYITHYFAGGLPIDLAAGVQGQLWQFIGAGYVFKLAVALLDTIPFYLGVGFLSRYLQIDPTAEHDADAEEAAEGVAPEAKV